MSEPDTTRKTFVLGAGFSCKAGFPLVKDLRTAVVRFIEKHPQPDWLADLTPGAKGFQLGQFYEGMAAADSTALLGFEELLVALQTFRNRPLHPANRTRAILEAACGRLLWQIQTALTLPICYHNFAAWLFPSSSMPKHNVISFNWDLVVERALQDQSDNWFYSQVTDDSVAVLKPHGSINWSNHRGHGLVADSDVWAKAVLDGTLDCLRDDRFRDPFESGINEQFRYLILPGEVDHGALKASQPIWDLAQSAIARSGTVVFIGYSLPSYDTSARDLLKLYCDGKSIEVYNPSPRDLERFRNVFGSEAVLKRQTFEECIYGATTPKDSGYGQPD